MKRWPFRIFWVSAWAIWAWLGVGLHRELPRDLGPLVSNLPKPETIAWPLGFIGDSNEFAYRVVDFEEQKPAIAVYHAETGELLRKTTYSRGARDSFGRFTTRRHGMHFAVLPEEPNPGLHVLDVRRGTWKFITSQPVRDLAVHPDRPWVMFVEEFKPQSWTQRVVVHDFHDDRTIYSGATTPIKQSGRTFFIPGSPLIVVPSGKSHSEALNDLVAAFEVWNLEGEPVKLKELDGAVIGAFATAGANGYFAFGLGAAVEAYDVHQERIVFEAGVREPGFGSVYSAPPLISASGCALIDGYASAVWNVKRGTPIWRPASFEQARITESNEFFHVRETWHQMWERWLPTLNLETCALRRFDDGGVLYRMKAGQLVWPSYINRSETLVLAEDGSVRMMPPRVDWMVLALCQTILALPLILLWAILRWRSRRAARRQRDVSNVGSRSR